MATIKVLDERYSRTMQDIAEIKQLQQKHEDKLDRMHSGIMDKLEYITKNFASNSSLDNTELRLKEEIKGKASKWVEKGIYLVVGAVFTTIIGIVLTKLMK